MRHPALDDTASRHLDFEARGEDPAGLVSARLRRSGYPFLRGIKCEVRDGVSVLTGSVPTFHLKQLAQELASYTPGVRQVVNQLEVTNWSGLPRRSAAAS